MSSGKIIVLDSSDDDDNSEERITNGQQRRSTAAKPATVSNRNKDKITKHIPYVQSTPVSAKKRRIQPTLLSSTLSESSKRRRLHSDDDSDGYNDSASSLNVPPGVKAIGSSGAKNADAGSPTMLTSVRNPAASRKFRAHIASTSPQLDTKSAETSPPASDTSGSATVATSTTTKTPFSPAFSILLAACRTADTSADMELLITRKLIRYYHSVPVEYVGSKSFNRAAMRVAAEIRAQPALVYLKLAGILEELNIRRHSAAQPPVVAAPTDSAKPTKVLGTDMDMKIVSVVSGAEAVAKISMGKTSGDVSSAVAVDNNDSAAGRTSPLLVATASPATPPTPSDTKKAQQIKRLNAALSLLNKRIVRLDEAEVDLNDEDNSAFLLVERYKKRAYEIYEKICALTGESKHACRSTRQPIAFSGTAYPQFNRTIQAFVNRTRMFPDLFDVRRCLEHCNQQYALGLGKEEVARVAQDAFVKIGRLLQRRRKMDLYETMSYLTSVGGGDGGDGQRNGGEDAASTSATTTTSSRLVDPATTDPELQRKLTNNEKEYRRRINAIIDKYADEQLRPNSQRVKEEDDTKIAAQSPPESEEPSQPPETSPSTSPAKPSEQPIEETSPIVAERQLSSAAASNGGPESPSNDTTVVLNTSATSIQTVGDDDDDNDDNDDDDDDVVAVVASSQTSDGHNSSCIILDDDDY